LSIGTEKPPFTSNKASSLEGGTTSNSDKLGLEEIVHLTNKIGLEYAEAKKQLDKMELLKPTIRARITIRLDTGGLNETKLKRLTEVDEEYVAYMEELVETRSRCDKLKIRYESYKNLFDARRSLLSYQKAEMKLL